MDAADAGRIPVGGDDMDPSETIYGELEGAPAEVVMESDIRIQSLGQKCRVGDAHMAIAAEREEVRGNAQWWHFETPHGDTQSRADRGASFVLHVSSGSLHGLLRRMETI